MDIPALITDAGNALAKHKNNIGIAFGVVGGGIGLASQLFGLKLVPYGESIIFQLTRDGTMVGLLFLIAMIQVMMYQRVRWVVDTLESIDSYDAAGEARENQQEESDEDENLRADGGSSLPPRDSEGKFTSKSQGGSNLIIVLLAAGAGYAFGSQYGPQEAAAGALICAGFVVLLLD
jgi:hypothetical protein